MEEANECVHRISLKEKCAQCEAEGDDLDLNELLSDRRSFQDNYLTAARALDNLEKALVAIGMAGNRSFDDLRKEFIRHGATTARDSNL